MYLTEPGKWYSTWKILFFAFLFAIAVFAIHFWGDYRKSEFIAVYELRNGRKIPVAYATQDERESFLKSIGH
jgi:hypothetical protein